MRKKIIARLAVVLALILTISCIFAGCDGLFGNRGDDSPKEYTIQYTDDVGTHTLNVKEGAPYSLESIPSRYGYEFLGLFDAQTGGKQYVGANGSSLTPFRDNESLILFPQFSPLEYTVILDYGDAAVTGVRSVTATYDNELPELPNGLSLAHHSFTGWYTEKNGNGIQIADAYGNIPLVSVFNKKNFNIDDEARRVYLYAGFAIDKQTVTFNFGDGIPAETMLVPYDTPIGDIVPKTRNDKGEAGATWSKSQGGAVFSGNVTEDMTLYVRDWAPVIELNGNGVEIAPIVAKAGTTITLPIPEKPLAKFLYWEDENGEEYTSKQMPDRSIKLNAVWQAKIVFDENGGSDVADISEPTGETIALPKPEKDGYIFAGWYTADKEKYTQTKMPYAGIALKAGWYKAKSASKTLVDGNSSVQSDSHRDTFMDALTLNFSEYLPSDFDGDITVTVKWQEKNTDGGKKKVAVGFYSKKTVSEDYLILRTVIEHADKSYMDVERTFNTHLTGNKIYVTLASDSNSTGWLYNGYVSDFRYQLTYPDISFLYL